MFSLKKTATLAAFFALPLAGTAVLAAPAGATTSTCTNIANPTSPPIGCGGIYLPGMGSGTQPNSSSLTLSATGSSWNDKVVIEPYSASDSSEDFTVFEVCNTVAGPRTAASPCGSGTPTIDPISGRNEYVAEYTPNGDNVDGNAIPANLTGTPAADASNSLDNLCISVEKPAGWKHWWTVLRTCSTYGAEFFGGSPAPLPSGGVPGVVTSTNPNHANPYQIFSPVPVTGGYVLAEDAVSGGFHSGNSLQVLNDTAQGGAGTWQMLYPETDTANAIWKVIGCTNPVTSLTPGFYNCP